MRGAQQLTQFFVRIGGIGMLLMGIATKDLQMTIGGAAFMLGAIYEGSKP